MPFVDSDTHDQRLRALPNPTAWIWDEIHPAGGPPNWDHHLYWPWENVRMLLTFVPSRMRSVPDRAVVLLYKPMPLPPPLVNPLGLRPQSLQRLMGYCCGSARANSCPIGECYSFLQCFILIIQGSAWQELAVIVRLHSRLLQLFRGIQDSLQPLTGVFASWTGRTLNKWTFQLQLKCLKTKIVTVIGWGRVKSKI